MSTWFVKRRFAALATECRLDLIAVLRVMQSFAPRRNIELDLFGNHDATDATRKTPGGAYVGSRHFNIMIATCVWSLLTSTLSAADGNSFIEFSVIVPQRFYSPQNWFPTDPAYLVIRSNAEWIGYGSTTGRLSRAPGAGRPADPTAHVPPPEVDFDRYTLLAISTGPKPSLGYSVSISSVVRDKAQITVTVLDVGPGGSQCAIMSMISHPMVFALIAKTQEPIRFEIHQVQTDCNIPPRTIDGES